MQAPEHFIEFSNFNEAIVSYDFSLMNDQVISRQTVSTSPLIALLYTL
jgi:hypothetical protein